MSDRDGEAATALTYLTRLLQLVLIALTAYAVLTLKAGLLVNVGLPLLIALFPDYVRYRYDYRLNAVLSLWIVLSAFLHALGILGLYTTFGWYDQVAHGVSGSMVAGVGYAIVSTVEARSATVHVPSNLRVVFVVIFASAFGVVWEIAEFALTQAAAATGGDALLVQYGLDDVVYDLLFNAVGAFAVALWATEYFADLRALVVRGFGSVDGE